MIYSLFSIFDLKVKYFHIPFVLHNEDMAIRAFREVIRSGQTDVSKHPEDFVLFKLGTFNDETGELVRLEAPVSLVGGLQFLEKE